MKKTLAITKDNFLTGLMVISLLAALYLISKSNYLLFHSLAELFSIVVASSIFVVYWNTRRLVENNFLVFIGVAYLFIGLIDLVHTLAYQGMGVFPTNDANLPTQLWIAARYSESLSLLAATLFLRRKMNANLLLHVYALIFILAMISVFGGFFPDCYIEGQGLTPFKKMSEYLISLLLLGTILRLTQKKSVFDLGVYRLIIASLIMTVLSELAFTFYINVYGFSNFVGHIFKIASFSLIYLALVQTGLKKPYATLFSDLKQRETQLQTSEARYRELFNSIHSGVAVYEVRDGGDDFVFIDFNQAGEKIDAIRKTEIVGKSVNQAFPGIEKFGLLDVFRRVWKTGEPEYHPITEYRDERIAGWRENYVYKLPTDEIVAVFTDLTSQQQTRQNLQESEERFRSVFEDSGIAMALIDADGRYVQVNRAMTDIFGYSQDELLSMGSADITYPGDPLPSSDEIRSLWTGQKRNTSFKKRYLHKDGHLIWGETNVSQILDTSRKAQYLLGQMQDISAQIQAEEDRQRLLEQVIQDANELEKRVHERTEQYQTIINLTTNREVRMAGLKRVIKQLRKQLLAAGLNPVADDPLQEKLP